MLHSYTGEFHGINFNYDCLKQNTKQQKKIDFLLLF